MIKRFTVFLVLVLLLSFLPDRALLAQTVRPIVGIEPAEQVVEPGATFTVDVVIEETVDLGGYEFRVSFDASVVEVTKVKDAGYLGSTGRQVFPVNPEIDNEVGTVRYGAASVGGSAGPDGSGRLAILTFEAVGPGTTELHLHQVLIADTDVAQQVPRLQHGQVTVGAGTGPPDEPTESPGVTATSTPGPIPTEAATAVSTGAPSPTSTASSAEVATATSASAPSPTPNPTGEAVPASTGAPSPTSSVETPSAGGTDQSASRATATGGADGTPAATAASSGSESAEDTGSTRAATTASETIPSPTSAGERTPQGEDEVETAEETPTSAGTSEAGTRTRLERIVLLGLVPVLIAGGVYLMVFLPRRLLRQDQGGGGGGKDG